MWVQNDVHCTCIIIHSITVRWWHTLWRMMWWIKKEKMLRSLCWKRSGLLWAMYMYMYETISWKFYCAHVFSISMTGIYAVVKLNICWVGVGIGTCTCTVPFELLCVCTCRRRNGRERERRRWVIIVSTPRGSLPLPLETMDPVHQQIGGDQIC